MASVVDFADLKKLMDLENSNISDYPDLELIADSVHANLENWAGRKLDLSASKTETGILYNSKFISLTNLPISSITSVTVDGNTLTSDDYDQNDYGITLKLARSGAWSVVSVGGFTLIPDDIYRAELYQIAYEYQHKNNIGATSFNADGGGYNIPGFIILDDVKRLLAKYIHPDQLGIG